MNAPVTIIGATALQAIRRHASLALPVEACGALLGVRAGDRITVSRAVPARNVSPLPRCSFEIDPRVVLALARSKSVQAGELVGFYHSHPCGDTRPSRLDRAGAWCGYANLIITMRGAAIRSVACWRRSSRTGPLMRDRLGISSD